MIIERFRSGDPHAVGERFAALGRQIPDGSGVSYVSSWMTADGARCFQLMEAPSADALGGWLERWSDLVEFEVIPVATSAEFWAKQRS